MNRLKNAIFGAGLGVAFIAAVFAGVGALLGWLFYVVPWVYGHAPSLGLPNDFAPFFVAMASAFAGPAILVGAITGFKDD